MLSISCGWELDQEAGQGRGVRHSQVEDRERLVLTSQQCPVVVETTPEPTTIVHDIEEDTTTEMVEADDIDIAEDPAAPVPPGGSNSSSSSSLSSTTDPAPDLSLALSTEC